MRDALINQATVGFADSEGDPMQRLMDNAVSANQSLQLTVGIALTAAQVAQLTQDMVWLVEQKVNGETVLVPRVYLASVSEGDLLAQNNALRVGGDINLRMEGDIDLGANVASRGTMSFSAGGDLTQSENIFSHSNIWLDAGGDLTALGRVDGDLVELTAGGNINNLGELTAGRGLWLDAGGSIINHSVGEMVSTGLLNLHAVNDIINQQGYMEGVDVTLTTELGDIINRTEFEQITQNTRSGGLYTSTTVGENSIIVSHNSLMMDAGNNIDLQGSSLAAAGTISLNAGNDVLLGAVENKMAYQFDAGRFSGSQERTTYQVVNIDAGEHLLINAGRDIVGEGSQLNAGGSAMLGAGRDISLSAVANVDHTAFAQRNYEMSSTTVTHTQAALNAGGDVQVVAGQDINFTGTNVAAGGHIITHAERDTNIVAVLDSSENYEYQRRSGSLGSSRTDISHSYQETVVGGTLNAGGLVLMNTQIGADGQVISLDSGSINVVGGQVTAGSHVLMSADEDINITGLHYQNMFYEESRRSGSLGLSSRSEGGVTNDIYMAGASIDAGGSMQINAGNDFNLIGSSLDAEGSIRIDVVNNTLIAAGETHHEADAWSESSRFNLMPNSNGDIFSSSESGSGYSATGVQSSVINAGGDVIIDTGSGQIIGSDITAGGTQRIEGHVSNIEVLAARSSSESYTHDREIRVGLGDMADGVGSSMVSNDNGRLTVTLASASYESTTTSTQETTVTGSTLTAGDDLVLRAVDDIFIEGATLTANVNADGVGESLTINTEGDIPDGELPSDDTSGGYIVLQAGNNITVKEATETFSYEEESVSGSAELSVVVQHQAVEVAMAIKALDDAKDDLRDARRDLREHERQVDTIQSQLANLEAAYAAGNSGIRYADILELREIASDLESHSDWLQAGVVAAEAQVGARTISLAQQTAAAAQSTGTYGFNAGLQLDIDAEQSQTSIQSTTSVASHLSGAGIVMQTGWRADGNHVQDGTSVTIQGSHLNADELISIDTGELNILASQDTYSYSNETERGQITAQMTVYGAGGGLNVNADFSRSQAGENSTTHNNSTLNADRISLTTTGDANIRGGNVHANEHLFTDIGGDLNLESVQDRHRSQDSTAGLSAGGSAGSVNAGLNQSSGMSITRETVVSSLTSGNTAEVNVAGTTRLTGALLGTVDENGNDLGNLNLNTGDLQVTHLMDVSHGTQSGLSGSVNASLAGPVGTGTEQAEGQGARDADGNRINPNTTTVGASNSVQSTVGFTHATIGSGTITVGGTLLEQDGELTEAGQAADSPLGAANRDTATVSNTLWDVDSTASVDLQLDHRLLNQDGLKEIAGELGSLGENIQIIAQDVPAATGGNAIENMIGSVLDTLGDYTGGIIPSDKNAGGLIANLPGYVGVGDNQAVDVVVMPPDAEVVIGGEYNFVPVEELTFLSQEQKDQFVGQMALMLVPGQERSAEVTTYQNSLNGILNPLGAALDGGLMRTQDESYIPGTAELTALHNPTHGWLSDILEAGVDKFLPWQTGASRQQGGSEVAIVQARMVEGLETNFVLHSQAVATGGTSALNGNVGEGFAHIRSEFRLGEGDTLPVTYVAYGGAASHTAFRDSVERAGGVFLGAYANPGDIVSELVSLNRGNLVPPSANNPTGSQSESLNIVEGISATINSLINGSMSDGAHSYQCQNNCGNQPPLRSSIQLPSHQATAAEANASSATSNPQPTRQQSNTSVIEIPIILEGSDE